jgi:hypothetical protein
MRTRPTIFNYYTGRMKIPVIDGAAEIAALRNAKEKRYLLIKKRALEELPEIAAEPVIATTALGKYHLVSACLRTLAP